LRNLRRLYAPLAARWWVLDNSASSGPVPVASGGRDLPAVIHDPVLWRAFEEASGG
jgi:hypothetical protein